MHAKTNDRSYLEYLNFTNISHTPQEENNIHTSILSQGAIYSAVFPSSSESESTDPYINENIYF